MKSQVSDSKVHFRSSNDCAFFSLNGYKLNIYSILKLLKRCLSIIHAIYTIIFLTPEKHHKQKVNFRERLQSNKKRPSPPPASDHSDEVFKDKKNSNYILRADSGYSNSEEQPPVYIHEK